ncbi:MAG: helix-turn-helix transcriptional regulator [Planctomycetota bacterium]
MDKDSFISAMSDKIREYGIRAMGREIGVSQPSINQWMEGRPSLSWEKVEAMAAVLGVRVEKTETYKIKKA